MTDYYNYIGGQWVDGSDEIVNVNPSDLDDVIGRYARGGPADVEHAVEAARDAAARARAMTPQERADLLHTVGQELLDRAGELGTLLAREEGKTRHEGVAEATRAGHIFRFFAGEAVRIAGDVMSSVRPGVRVETMREPVGVVGLITPWNFPLAIPAWKIAPALAYGNAVVFKPAELVPGCAWELTSILDRAGVPPGMFNLVMGRGSDVGRALVGHEHVDAVSFTGSASIGRSVAIAAVERLAKVQLEMGGKNPYVVLADADLDTAVECVVQGAFYSTGQRCTASSRVIVTEGVHDRFVELLSERIATLRVGDALADDTDIGPVVDERQLQTDLDYIELGQAEGATLLTGGERVTRNTDGYYLEPALFVDSSTHMRINQEEIFGPVASVIKVADYDEALAVANDTEFGLIAGIATTSLKHAHHFQANSASGMVAINVPTVGSDYHVPFGGRKGSSYGPREQGAYAREFYTAVKTTYLSS